MKFLLACTLTLLATAQPARAAQLSEAPFPVPVGAFPDDPADSLYSAARAALAERRYERAADLFHEITTEYPKSSYAANAAYYEAFARSRLGDVDNLRQAYRILQGSAKVLSADARALEERVCGLLVRKGDSSCKKQLQYDADRRTKEPTTDSTKCPTEGDEGDIRIAALDALLQVDADKALPILKQILARRDPCSVELRRKAVFLVSQKAGSEAADILLETARTDPDQDVREQAVFWLSRSGTAARSGCSTACCSTRITTGSAKRPCSRSRSNAIAAHRCCAISPATRTSRRISGRKRSSGLANPASPTMRRGSASSSGGRRART